jgi:hypothetical protein
MLTMYLIIQIYPSYSGLSACDDKDTLVICLLGQINANYFVMNE